MSLVGNERTKLTATAVSSLGLAMGVSGFVAPIVALSFGLSSAPLATGLTHVVSFAWLGAAGALHVLARRMLKQLEP